MKTTFKITRKLFESIKSDLLRPHAFAHERMGWIRCRVANLSKKHLLILAHDYYPVDDLDYIKTIKAAGMMNSAAIRKALQLALDQRVSIFHVHLHNHAGATGFSMIDREETNKFIPPFWNVRPEMPHGAVVFSKTSIAGRCWYREGKIINVNKLVIVGEPILSVELK